ncbi:MAG: PaREP1 family protein [Candidatus Syntrophoarchaeum sp.]|nr:PaREP1 family protein [Candidatus Syntrophoarchaeum sp.]
MGAASIALPQRLVVKLREKAEETDSLPEELGVELLQKSLNEELDPEELVEHYQSMSEKYLAEAKELLSEGDVAQASEKFWGASALAVKRVAASRGLKLEKHRGLWDFVNELLKESGDRDIIRFFNAANSLHRNFYEDQMSKESLEIVAEDIEQLIEKLRMIS